MDVARAVRVLRRGGLVAFPTETTYGLGCDPRKRNAVRRIFRVKGRDPSKPLLLVASSYQQVRRVAQLSGAALALARRHWPGTLTLVLPIKRPTHLAPGVAVRSEVAIRVSSSRVVRALCRRFRFPIVATSANLSGQPEARSARAVRRVFGKRLDFILDGGALPKRKPSTVARVRKDGTVHVIRKGAIRL